MSEEAVNPTAPVPWFIHDVRENGRHEFFQICSVETREVVAVLYGEEQRARANAELLVRAINNFGILVRTGEALFAECSEGAGVIPGRAQQFDTALLAFRAAVLLARPA
jgi:hypothetical protein